MAIGLENKGKTMPTPLATVFSSVDSMKRRLIDALRNPVEAAQQMVGNASDRARGLRELTSASAQEMRQGLLSGGSTDGPHTQKLIQVLIDAYNPMGMTSIGPRSAALETARKNAVKMLGLPENNTAMDRAKALGFDTELFHGADKDVQSLKPRGARGHLGSLYTSDTPKTPNEYAMLGAQIDDLLPSHLKGDKSYLDDFYADDLLEYALETQKKAPNRQPNVMPLLARSKGSMDATESFGDHAKYFKTEYPKEIRQSWDDAYPVLGNDAAILQNADPHLIGMQVTGEVGDYTASKGVPMLKFLPDPETGTNTFVIQNPANVRSRFAAFDPARVNENDLLGRADPRLLGLLGIGAAGGVGAYNYLKDKK